MNENPNKSPVDNPNKKPEGIAKPKPWNRNTVAIIAFAVALVAIVGGVLALVLGGGQSYTGYLICQDCGRAGTCASAKIDLTKTPELHTLKCAKMADCVMSGYGISVKQDNGKYKFVPFDEHGSELALSNVVYKTLRPDHLLVEVRGTLKDGVLAVDSLTEK